MTENQGLLVTAAILLAVGIGLLIAGAFMYHYYGKGKQKKCSKQTTGTVVNQYFTGNNRLQPIIEYTVDGKVYQQKNYAVYSVQAPGEIGFRNGYEIGQQLTVHYDPDKPSRWMVGSAKIEKLVALIFLASGVLFLGLAALMYMLS